MYSLLRRNNLLASGKRCGVRGEKLVQMISRERCLLCCNSRVSIMSLKLLRCSSSANSCYYLLNSKLLTIRDCDILKPKSREDLVYSRLNYGFLAVRDFHTGPLRLGADPLKPSSKVEETVHVLKEKAKEQAKEGAQLAHDKTITTPAPPKKTIKQRIVDELIHYYHGFRLLFIDINVSRKLIWRVLQGYSLTRREHKLLVRTVGDLFRLVPFSVFIIVPFMELLLPVFIKFFPGMLPSTFQTTSEKEDKMKQALKVKLEMAKFLQRTLDEMAVSSKGHSSQSAKEFAQFFEKIRTSGEMTTTEEIMKFSKLFEDEITLDSLPRPQLMALCRVLEMNPIGTTNFLRFQLRLKLRSLSADDMMIQREGVDSLSQAELQAACRARGMRALGVSEERLKAQLSQWLDLSLIKKVPPSLLLLSQAFMLPETTTTSEKLAATISALPDVVGTQTKAVIGEREGKVDNKTKIEVIKEEMTKIREERKEQLEEEAQLKLKEACGKKEEVMVDPAPTLVDKSMMMEPALRAVLQDIKKTSISDRIADIHVTTKDFETLEKALDDLGNDQRIMFVEKEELQELRQEMAEYQEDIADLQKVASCAGKGMEVKESRAAQLLFKRVNKMICKMDTVLDQLEKQQCKESTVDPHKQRVSMLKIADLIAAVHKLEKDPNSPRLELLTEVLEKLDADQDGAVKVETVLKVIEMVGKEKVKLSKKQMDELLALIYKEEAIELDDQIIRALRKKEDKEDKGGGGGSGEGGGGSGPGVAAQGEQKTTIQEDKEGSKDKNKVKTSSPRDSENTVVLTIVDKAVPPSGASGGSEEMEGSTPSGGRLGGSPSTPTPPPQILDPKSPAHSLQHPKELR